jgi:hypothetical protein
MTTLNGAAEEAVDGAARPDIVAQAQRLLALGYRRSSQNLSEPVR